MYIDIYRMIMLYEIRYYMCTCIYLEKAYTYIPKMIYIYIRFYMHYMKQLFYLKKKEAHLSCGIMFD